MPWKANQIYGVPTDSWGTGYDDSDEDRGFLQAMRALENLDERETYEPGLRWPVVEPLVEVPPLLSALYPQGRGPSFARAAAVAGGTTTVLYYALTHGGDFDWEVGWVFTPSSDCLYVSCHDEPMRCVVDGKVRDDVRGDVWRLSLQALGVEEASAYWAPHVTSFHWRPYHLG